MPKLPGINHRDAVRALEKAGFRIAREGKHVVMTDGTRILTIPRHFDPPRVPAFLAVPRCAPAEYLQGSTFMKRIRYVVATSLDGYIAGPKGEADWIIMDPAIDFRALFAQFDTFLLGRRTFEAMTREGRSETPGMKTFVFSRTLRQQDYPGVTIVAEKAEETIAALRAERGKDIWLFGGGSLFRSLLELGLADTVEVAIIPVLLGGGIPLLPSPAEQTKLKLTDHKVYKTGIVSLEYAVQRTRPNKSLQPTKARRRSSTKKT